MRNISKGVEPKSLELHRCSTHANYRNYADKPTLREALVTEQRGLCCYCLSRIVADREKMKIEHWQSQENFPEYQLDYSNLLGVCLGGEGNPPKFQHCDTRKGEQDLSLNPAEPAHDVERTIHYLSDGTIQSPNPVFDREINEFLNLNTALLKANRKAVLDGFLGSKPKQGDWKNSSLAKWLAEWNGDLGDEVLDPHCQVVIYWLRKRLKQT